MARFALLLPSHCFIADNFYAKFFDASRKWLFTPIIKMCWAVKCDNIAAINKAKFGGGQDFCSFLPICQDFNKKWSPKFGILIGPAFINNFLDSVSSRFKLITCEKRLKIVKLNIWWEVLFKKLRCIFYIGLRVKWYTWSLSQPGNLVGRLPKRDSGLIKMFAGKPLATIGKPDSQWKQNILLLFFGWENWYKRWLWGDFIPNHL